VYEPDFKKNVIFHSINFVDVGFFVGYLRILYQLREHACVQQSQNEYGESVVSCFKTGPQHSPELSEDFYRVPQTGQWAL
jgi:hypothetical protein